MKIAFISYEYPPDTCMGGIATYVWQAAHMLSHRGHEVEVFASSEIREGFCEDQGVLVHWVKEDSRNRFADTVGPVFAARHEEKAFDVLEGPEYKADARKAVELVPEIPLVVKMHTPTLLVARLNDSSGPRPYLRDILSKLKGKIRAGMQGRAKSFLSLNRSAIRKAEDMDAVESALARKAAMVAPPSQDLCDFARSDWNISLESIRLAPHAYVPAKKILSLEPRASGTTIGFVGRLEKRKGIEILAEAIPPVLDAFPEARFRLVGSSQNHASGLPYDVWIKRRLSHYANRIEIPGKYPLARMAEVYGTLDICVFPSLWDNFPNVCLEAMAAGKAIVASSAGGMKEILSQGEAGRLFPAGDAASLSQEIMALLRSSSERKRLGLKAREKVLKHYNESVIGEMMEKIYAEAIDRGPQQTKEIQ